MADAVDTVTAIAALSCHISLLPGCRIFVYADISQYAALIYICDQLYFRRHYYAIDGIIMLISIRLFSYYFISHSCRQRYVIFHDGCRHFRYYFR